MNLHRAHIRLFQGLFISFAVALLLGCAAHSDSTDPFGIPYTLDGPALFVVGDMEGLPLEGTLDRGCMVGLGSIFIQSKDSSESFVCKAELDAPPVEKGRVRGRLMCSQDRIFAISLRNLGPDQGLAIARELTSDQMIVLFYHASPDEAKRRFPSILEDIRAARAQNK